MNSLNSEVCGRDTRQRHQLTRLLLSPANKEITTCPTPLSYTSFSLWSNIHLHSYTLFISLFVEQVFQVLPKIILQPLVSILIVLVTVGLAAGQTLLYSDNSTQLVLQKKMNYTVKKGYRFSRPHPSRGLTNQSYQTLPGGQQFNYSLSGKVWLVTSCLGTGNR
jgi:hypothetical protein